MWSCIMDDFSYTSVNVPHATTVALARDCKARKTFHESLYTSNPQCFELHKKAEGNAQYAEQVYSRLLHCSWATQAQRITKEWKHAKRANRAMGMWIFINIFWRSFFPSFIYVNVDWCFIVSLPHHKLCWDKKAINNDMRLKEIISSSNNSDLGKNFLFF